MRMNTQTVETPSPADQEVSWVRVLRTVILSSIAVGAAVAIVALLGVEIGETGARIIGTAFSITGAALLSLPAVAAWERKKLAWLPIVGIASAVVGFGMFIFDIWVEPGPDAMWKIPLTLVIIASAIAGMALLEFAQLREGQAWVLTSTRVLLAAVAGLLIVALWGDIENDGYWRGFGVVAVLLSAFLASIPLLHRSSRKAQAGEFCPVCGSRNQAVVGELTQCTTCEVRYRILF